MKQTFFSLLLAGTTLLLSCAKEKKGEAVPLPNDITFEDITLPEFSYKVPDAPFKTGGVTLNVKKQPDGGFSGFAISNKNWRSYPWRLSPDFAPGPLTPAQVKECVDSCIFSVYTSRPNHTGNYLVASVKDDDAAITLEKAAVVEHVLVANTTYNFLLESHGSVYSGTVDAASQAYTINGTKVRNIQIPNTSTDFYGRFTLPGPKGENLLRLAGQQTLAKRAAGKTAADAARLAGKPQPVVLADSTAAADATVKGFVKLSVLGFAGDKPTGTVDFWLAVLTKVDPANPAYSFVMSDWNKVDLQKLGMVDKLVFRLSSSDTDGAGNMRTPAYFCLDGIRIRP